MPTVKQPLKRQSTPYNMQRYEGFQVMLCTIYLYLAWRQLQQPQFELTNHYFVLPKGFFDQKTAADMMKESEKMQNFNHPHVLNIVGVCLDAGPAPYIIMPFIANGSLLAYIKKEKTNLVVPNDADNELAS